MKLSKVSFFLFVTIYNYLWFRMLLFNYFYNNFGSMGILYVLLLIILVIVFYTALPKRIYQTDYEKKFQKSWIKTLYTFMLYLESIFSISFCAYLLSDIFIMKANFGIILFGIIFAVIVLSRLIPKDVMELSTLFNIIGYIVLCLSFLYIPNLDYSNLLPFKKLDSWALLSISIMMIGDNLTLLIHKKDVNFSKLSFILALFIAIFFLGFEYFLLICSSGTEFFKDINYVGFICFSIEPVSKYIGSFDFSYIFYILISCIFKYAYNLSVIRHSVNLSNKFVGIISFALLFSLGMVCYYFIPINKGLLDICFILTCSSIIILFWFIKECYFVRKSKE